MKLGFNTQGTEEIFENILGQKITLALNERQLFTYLEVGIAEGTTLKAVADFCLAATKQDPDAYLSWNAIGIDLENGPFFNAHNFLAQTRGHNVELIRCNGNKKDELLPVSAILNIITIGLLPNGETLLDCKFPVKSIHFAVIDGCHGAPCVERDFLAIEKAIAIGGIVAFHDAMPEDQHAGWQVHCQQWIEVRHALNKLELIESTRSDGALRQGWEWVADVHGDKSANPPGNGFAFFRKIS